MTGDGKKKMSYKDVLSRIGYWSTDRVTKKCKSVHGGTSNSDCGVAQVWQQRVTCARQNLKP